MCKCLHFGDIYGFSGLRTIRFKRNPTSDKEQIKIRVSDISCVIVFLRIRSLKLIDFGSHEQCGDEVS